MNMRRIAILLHKELAYGSKSFLFIFAVVTPLVTSLIVSLLFGRLLAQAPRLGIAAASGSQVLAQLAGRDYLIVRPYASDPDLKKAVAGGRVDVGLVLPEDFEAQLQSGAASRVQVYVWGESQIRSRVMITAALGEVITSLAGRSVPVEVSPVNLGAGPAVPWFERLLPLLVLMTMLLGGMLVPAGSLVDEKQGRTLSALTLTPASLGEVVVAKGLLGLLLSLVMGLVILGLNRAAGSQPVLLLAVLGLSATLAAAFGLLLGSLFRDINSMFAALKGLALVLYAPGIIYLFPQIPGWIARLFPTYYMFDPVVKIARNSADLAEVGLEVLVLAGLTLLVIGALALVVRRVRVAA